MLTREQSDAFALEVWLRVPGLLGPDELHLLQIDTADLIASGEPIRSSDPTFQYGPSPTDPSLSTLFRINDLVSVHEMQSILRLIGHPRLLASVSRLLGGKAFAPISENLVFILPGRGFGHRWHQDPPPIKLFPAIMAGIYLEDSAESNGALTSVQRSHLHGYHGSEDWIFALPDGPFGNTPTSRVVEAYAGDVVFHATTLVHGSPWSRADSLRRTVYIRFDHIDDVRLHPPNGWTRTHYLSGEDRLQQAIVARCAYYADERPFSPKITGEHGLA